METSNPLPPVIGGATADAAVLKLTDALPSELVDLFASNPDGVARNILDASLKIRVPQETKTLHDLDEWAKSCAEVEKRLKGVTVDAFRASTVWIGLSKQYNGSASSRPLSTRRATVQREPTFIVSVNYRGSYYRDVVQRVDICEDDWDVEVPLSVASGGAESVEDYIRQVFYDNYYDMYETDTDNIDYDDTRDAELEDCETDIDYETVAEWAEDMQ